jgi:hypothetical protein
MLSSKKSINLNAFESINLDTTGDTILQSGNVYLGSKSATEPVLLGQSTINLLQTLLQELATLTNVLSTQVGVPAGVPLAPTNVQAALTNATITNLITQLNSLMSNSVKNCLMSPLELNNLRQEELAARQNAQTNTEVQQVDPSIVLDNTPEGLKPKGSAKLGQKILNLGKQSIKIILPKLTSLVKEYAISEFQTAKSNATSSEQIEN